jgi:NAD(P)-dependent dehydrogenase (short-subunit alcohol dehydrogenase family)
MKNLDQIRQTYNLEGKTYAITGGGGVLAGDMALSLAGCGANVAILDRDIALAQAVIERAEPQVKDRMIPVFCDVLKKEVIEKAAQATLEKFGRIDGLINAAGGNHPKATTNPETSFFDIPEDAMRFVFDLNILGTVIPCQVFGRLMAQQKEGTIVNISSMNSFRPLTRIAAYSAAKAGVSNFTQWLAVHMAKEYSPNIRVNAIAPGFFLTQQNRFLMLRPEDGKLTPRGQTIMDHTPMGRFGVPEDLLGVMLWLISPAASFVTGIIVPIDGGFSAFTGI